MPSPSLGVPSQRLRYRPAPLFPALAPRRNGVPRVESAKEDGGQETSYPPDAAAATAAATSEAPPEASLTVSIPPYALPHVFAHRQWKSGLILADLLQPHAYPREERHQGQADDGGGGGEDDDGPLVPGIEGKTVLELGAGTALPGCVVATTRSPAHTLITDYDDELLLATLRTNVRDNIVAECKQTTGSAATAPAAVGAPVVRVVGHTWGKALDDLSDELARSEGVADWVLCADCIWDRLSHDALLATLRHVLSRRSLGSARRRNGADAPAAAPARALFVAGFHTGRETVCDFLRKAHRCGFRLARVERAWSAFRRYGERWRGGGEGGEVGGEEGESDEDEAERGGRGYVGEDGEREEVLSMASRLVLECEVADNEDEEPTDGEGGAGCRRGIVEGALSSSSSPDPASPLLISRRPRLTGRYRRFVVAPRPEEVPPSSEPSPEEASEPPSPPRPTASSASTRPARDTDARDGHPDDEGGRRPPPRAKQPSRHAAARNRWTTIWALEWDDRGASTC